MRLHLYITGVRGFFSSSAIDHGDLGLRLWLLLFFFVGCDLRPEIASGAWRDGRLRWKNGKISVNKGDREGEIRVSVATSPRSHDERERERGQTEKEEKRRGRC